MPGGLAIRLCEFFYLHTAGTPTSYGILLRPLLRGYKTMVQFSHRGSYRVKIALLECVALTKIDQWEEECELLVRIVHYDRYRHCQIGHPPAHCPTSLPAAPVLRRTSNPILRDMRLVSRPTVRLSV